MILRRITKHVREQNWTAIAIDFVIVVVGVFLGIQLGNWNTARAERAMERRYVLRLYDDMQRSQETIGVSVRFLARQVDDERVLLDALEACAVDEEDRSVVARALGAVGKFEFAVIDRQLIDQLRASDQFDVIRDLEVRARIARLIQASDNQLRVEPQFRDHAAPWTNYVRRFYYFDSPHGAESDRWERWENLRFDIEQACQDAEFLAAVGNTREATRNLHSWNASILESVVAAESALAEEITDRGWGGVMP